MAGTFAHITLVDVLCKDHSILDGIGTLTNSMRGALSKFANFCELGAVSPDYPYLTILDRDAEGWANIMHYWKTSDFIRSAIPRIFKMKYHTLDAQRCLAWLFGYAAHVVTDLTVHPVVNQIVGPYETNKREHRLCEINQDVYIFHEIMREDITSVNYIRDCGIASCGQLAKQKRLYSTVSHLWSRILSAIPLTEVKMKASAGKPSGAPNLDNWHENFIGLIDHFAEEGEHFPTWARRFAEHEGLVYPSYKDIQRSFIDDLPSPDGGKINYGELFQRAKMNIVSVWTELGMALDTGKSDQFKLANADLDTGMGDLTEGSIFWKA